MKQLASSISLPTRRARGRSERLFRTLQTACRKSCVCRHQDVRRRTPAQSAIHAEHNALFAVAPEEEVRRSLPIGGCARHPARDRERWWQRQHDCLSGCGCSCPKADCVRTSSSQVQCAPIPTTIPSTSALLARYTVWASHPDRSQSAAARRRQALRSGEPRLDRRTLSSTAPRPAAHAELRVGTEKRASGRTKKLTAHIRAA